MSEKKDNSFLMYKQFPLVRCQDIIYYGNMSDKYVIMLQVLENEVVNDLKVATKVSVQLMLTDTELKAKDRVVKKIDKDGIYTAMDIACIWLERALKS